MEAFRNDY